MTSIRTLRKMCARQFTHMIHRLQLDAVRMPRLQLVPVLDRPHQRNAKDLRPARTARRALSLAIVAGRPAAAAATAAAAAASRPFARLAALEEAGRQRFALHHDRTPFLRRRRRLGDQRRQTARHRRQRTAEIQLRDAAERHLVQADALRVAELGEPAAV